MIMMIGALVAVRAASAPAQTSTPTNPWYVPPSAPAAGAGYGSGYGSGYAADRSYGSPSGNGGGYYGSASRGYPGNGAYTTHSLPSEPAPAPAGRPYEQPEARSYYQVEQPQLRYQPLDNQAPRYEARQYQAPQYQQPQYQQPQQPRDRRDGYPGERSAYAAPGSYDQPYRDATTGPYWSGDIREQPQYYAQPQQQPRLAPRQQVYGDYPPLGSDPTAEPTPAPRRAAEPAPAASQQPSRTTAAGTYDPALAAGPTVLPPPGPYGGYGNYGAPYGGFSPFPGLPFW